MERTRPTIEVIRKMYVDDRMSIRAVARSVGYEATAIRTWLHQAGIPRRTISDAKSGQKPAVHTVVASVNSRRKHKLPGRGDVGYKLREDGYVDIWMPDHPDASRRGYIREHRLIMGQHLGRRLLDTEDVHHKNGDRADNRLENLETIDHAKHLREHYYEDDRCDPVTGRFRPPPVSRSSPEPSKQ